MKIITNPYNPYKEKGGVFTPTQQEEFQNSHLQNALDGSIVAYVPFILLQHHKVPEIKLIIWHKLVSNCIL